MARTPYDKIVPCVCCAYPDLCKDVCAYDDGLKLQAETEAPRLSTREIEAALEAAEGDVTLAFGWDIFDDAPGIAQERQCIRALVLAYLDALGQGYNVDLLRERLKEG